MRATRQNCDEHAGQQAKGCPICREADLKAKLTKAEAERDEAYKEAFDAKQETLVRLQDIKSLQAAEVAAYRAAVENAHKLDCPVVTDKPNERGKPPLCTCGLPRLAYGNPSEAVKRIENVIEKAAAYIHEVNMAKIAKLGGEPYKEGLLEKRDALAKALKDFEDI